MGLLDNLERKIERAVRKPFNGRGGELQPVELASALRNETDRQIVTRGERSIAPNDATFRFGTDSYAKAKEWGAPLAEELCDVLIRHARNQGYTLPSDVQVKFVKDASVEPHAFEVDTAFTGDDGAPLPMGSRPASAAEPQAADSTPQETQPATPPAPRRAPARAAAPVRRLDEPEMLGVIAVEGQRYAIEGDSVIIGRSQNADITVSDSGVSRQHVEITSRGGQFFARDLGSTNGTYLNGFPLEGEEQLTDGALLTISGTRISFRLIPQPEPSRQSRPSRFEPDVQEDHS